MDKINEHNNIIIVEDDSAIRDELEQLLIRYGYNVEAPCEFNNVVEYCLNCKADIILLDINLPFFDGFYICREIRKSSDIPIIVVTSRDTEVDELISMNLGADDFITKPYNTNILLARISSILKRTYKSSPVNDILSYNDLSVNLSTGTMEHKGDSIELTKNELRIIAHLIKHRGSIVPREDLMENLWDSEIFIDDNTLSVNITRLRKKLDCYGLYDIIETKRGIGYIIK